MGMRFLGFFRISETCHLSYSIIMLFSISMLSCSSQPRANEEKPRTKVSKATMSSDYETEVGTDPSTSDKKSASESPNPNTLVGDDVQVQQEDNVVFRLLIAQNDAIKVGVKIDSRWDYPMLTSSGTAASTRTGSGTSVTTAATTSITLSSSSISTNTGSGSRSGYGLSEDGAIAHFDLTNEGSPPSSSGSGSSSTTKNSATSSGYSFIRKKTAAELGITLDAIKDFFSPGQASFFTASKLSSGLFVVFYVDTQKKLKYIKQSSATENRWDPASEAIASDVGLLFSYRNVEKKIEVAFQNVALTDGKSYKMILNMDSPMTFSQPVDLGFRLDKPNDPATSGQYRLFITQVEKSYGEDGIQIVTTKISEATEEESTMDKMQKFFTNDAKNFFVNDVYKTGMEKYIYQEGIMNYGKQGYDTTVKGSVDTWNTTSKGATDVWDIYKNGTTDAYNQSEDAYNNTNNAANDSYSNAASGASNAASGASNAATGAGNTVIDLGKSISFGLTDSSQTNTLTNTSKAK